MSLGLAGENKREDGFVRLTSHKGSFSLKPKTHDDNKPYICI